MNSISWNCFCLALMLKSRFKSFIRRIFGRLKQVFFSVSTFKRKRNFELKLSNDFSRHIFHLMFVHILFDDTQIFYSLFLWMISQMFALTLRLFVLICFCHSASFQKKGNEISLINAQDGNVCQMENLLVTVKDLG